MSIAFPSSPILNQTTYTGGQTWIWNGKAWTISVDYPNVIVSNIAPSISIQGSLWYNTESAILFTRINNTWVETVSGSITEIYDYSITTNKIIDLAITNAKLAENVITTSKIQNGVITNAKLAENVITTSKITDLAITTSKLADNSITNIKLIDGLITNDKIADNSITASKIQIGTITADKLDPAIAPSLVDPLTTALKQYFDTTVLDDISFQFDGAKSVFTLAQNQVNITNIIDSKDLEVIINGIRLTPWVTKYTFPWQTPYSSFNGFRIDSSNLIIYNAPYRGDSAFLLLRRLSNSKQTQRYPYSATTIAFGD